MQILADQNLGGGGGRRPQQNMQTSERGFILVFDSREEAKTLESVPKVSGVDNSLGEGNRIYQVWSGAGGRKNVQIALPKCNRRKCFSVLNGIRM